MNLYEYFFNQADKIFMDIYADDNYIADKCVVAVKKHLTNKIISKFKNYGGNLLKDCAYDKGEKWELPEYVILAPHKILEFKYNDSYRFNYKYVELFYNTFPGDLFFYISTWNHESGEIPILKIFNAHDEFLGLIAPIKKNT